MTSRRIDNLVRDLRDDPDTVRQLLDRLDHELLTMLGAAIRDELRERAIADGDRDAVIERALDTGFGRDGLAVRPWVQAPFVVCPGGLIGKNRGNHKCRFVSADDEWVWESSHLIHEEKRSTPGTDGGFRAVALLPILDGMAIDQVSGRMRSGQHSVQRVISFEIRNGELVEVAQRDVSTRGLM